MTLAEVKRSKPFEVMLRSAVIGFAVAREVMISLSKALGNSDRLALSVVWEA